MNNTKYTSFIIIFLLAFASGLLRGQQTVTLTPSEDSWIRICTNPNYSYIINTNYNTIIFNHSDEWTIGGYRLASRMVMKFDLSILPENVEIVNAKIKLFAHNPQPSDDYKQMNFATTINPGYKQNACYLERITDNWEATTVTWANQPATSTENRIILPESQFINQDYDVDITAMVANMINNETNSHGIMMRLVNEEKYARMAFSSINHPNTALHPQLVIQYSPKKDKIEVGAEHGVLLKKDCSIWTWGDNTYGQLGSGKEDNKINSPEKIDDANNWINISSGNYHNLAIKSDGTLWAWGLNDKGQLGIGSTANENIPFQVGSDNNWKSISAGGEHSLAIKNDGTLWAWGYNEYGQLGTIINESPQQSTTPIQIGSDNNWKQVSAGEMHSLAIKNDGTLWAWGDNSFGALGNGTNIGSFSPKQILAGNNWKTISGGNFYSFGIKADLTLWGWGFNSLGQLGDGSTADSKIPKCIDCEPVWSNVSTAAGGHHTIAQTTDGAFFAWGFNGFGQLGDNSYVSKVYPWYIPEASNCISFAAGYRFSIIVKPDQQFCGTGANSKGQLGDYTYVDKKLYNCTPYPSSSSLKSARVNSNQNSIQSQEDQLIPELAKSNHAKSNLISCYPNPARANTTISYFLEPEAVGAKIVIRSLTNSYNREYPIYDKGNSHLSIDLHGLPAGVYSYYLIINGLKVDVKKFVIVN